MLGETGLVRSTPCVGASFGITIRRLTGFRG